MITGDLTIIVDGTKRNHLCMLLGATKTTTVQGQEDSTKEILTVITIFIELTTSTNRHSLHTPMATSFVVMRIVPVHDVAEVQVAGEKRSASGNLMVVTNTLDVWVATIIHRDAIMRMKMFNGTVTIVEVAISKRM
jgi:hypothetical protein